MPKKATAKGGLQEFAVIVQRSRDPAFRAALASVPRLTEFLAGFTPCEHPRDELKYPKHTKTIACNRAGCWLRTCNIYAMLKKLFDEAPHVTIPGGVKDAGRAALYMALEELAEKHREEKPHVYQNLFGEGTDTSAPGFFEGFKGPSFSRMVECVPRKGDASLRKAGIKKVPGTSYKAAALCGFKVSQLPSHRPPALPASLPAPSSSLSPLTRSWWPSSRRSSARTTRRAARSQRRAPRTRPSSSTTRCTR